MAKISKVDAFIKLTISQENGSANSIEVQKIIMDSIESDFRNHKFSTDIHLSRKNKKLFCQRNKAAKQQTA